MTREEAIDIVRSYLMFDKSNMQIDIALNMAIEALTQDSRKVTQAFTHTLPDGTEIPIDEQSYEIGYTQGQMADRPTGEWVYGTDPITGEKDCKAWTCSICGGKYPWQPNYCPNCGAKMGGDDE